MKKIYFAIALIAATFCLSPMTAFAQDPEPEDNGVILDKYVTGPDANGQYLITLESYATGVTVKTESEIMPPLNIVVLADKTKAMWTNQQTQNLAAALRTFLHSIPSPTDPNQKHNFSLIPFDETVKESDVMSHIQPSDSAAVYSKVIGYGTSGTLHSKPEYAFARAITEVKSYQSGSLANTNQTIVIFFTSTSRNNSGESVFDVNSGKNAVNLAYVLKQKGSLGGTKSVTMDNGKTLSYTEGLDCKVFSIANFKETKTATDGEENNVKHFMNFVSSLYPDKWMTNTNDFVSTTEGAEMPNGDNIYHQFSFDPKDIGEMFKKIQQEIIQPTIPINATSIVRDILTPDFQLPEGVSLNAGVKVYTQDCIYSGAPNYSISFSDTRNEITNSVTISVGGDGNRTIEVVGFDFAEHYCGYDEVQKVKTPHAGGQKLVITIPIETVADYQGGYDVPTNAQGSGIYPEGSVQPIEEFDIPSVDFPSIGIIKKGLSKGESATFRVKLMHDIVYDKDGNPQEVSGDPTKPFETNVILTGDGGTVPPYVILKYIPEGIYEVSESGWSWTYDVVGVSVDDGETQQGSSSSKVETKVLTKSQTSNWTDGITETVKCVLFTFTNEKKSLEDSSYAESVAKNKFKGGTVTTPGATTINSKKQPGEN